MPIPVLGVLGVIGAYFFFQWYGQEPPISEAQARKEFDPDVARWWREANAAARKHSVPVRLLLSITDQESNGRRQGMHPDGVSFDLLGLTDMALEDIALNRELTSLSPSEQYDAAGEYLALLKKREGTWWETTKFWNHGEKGGASYAAPVLREAGMSDEIPASWNPTDPIDPWNPMADDSTAEDSASSGQETTGNVQDDGGGNTTIDLGDFTPDPLEGLPDPEPVETYEPEPVETDPIEEDLEEDTVFASSGYETQSDDGTATISPAY